MTKRIFFILAVLAIIFLGVVILQKDNQKNKQIEMPVKQEDRSEKVEVEGNLVEGFPEIPSFPEAVVEKSYKKESGGKVGYEAEYLTDKNAKEAILWYKGELESQGWSIYDEGIEGIIGDYFISAERDGKKVNIFAESEEGKTEISVEIPLQ